MNYSTETNKVCSKCGEEKSVLDFYRRSYDATLYAHMCKKCMNKERNKYNVKKPRDPEAIIIRQKAQEQRTIDKCRNKVDYYLNKLVVLDKISLETKNRIIEDVN